MHHPLQSAFFLQAQGQLDEVLHAELLGTLLEEGLCQPFRMVLGLDALAVCAVAICVSRGRMLLRRVFLRWLKVVFTTLRKSASWQGRDVTLFRVRRMTALFTFGGGQNTCSSTVNRYSISYHACSSTLSMP